MVPTIRGAITESWRKMKEVLFQPFSWGVWVSLTLGLWLARLGEGGFRANINLSRSFIRKKFGSFEEFSGILEPFANELGISGLALLVAIGAVLFIVVVVLGFLLLWVRCRSRFIVLDMLVRGVHAETFGSRWGRFRRQGNSLFWTLLLLGVLIFLCICGMALFVVLLLIALIGGGNSLSPVFPLIVVCMVPLLLFAAALGFYTSLFLDYCSLQMYRTDCSGMEAWQVFNRKLLERPGVFVRYCVGLVLIALLIMGAAVLLSCATCCIGLIFLLLPFVSTMVLLPVLYVRWQYILEFFDNPEMLNQ